MSNRKHDRLLPWQQFRTRDPNAKSVFLDSGRAEIMFNMIVAPDLTDMRLYELIGAAFGASNGNPDILRLAIEALSERSDVPARKIERLWRSFELRAPDFDCVETLRQICNEQSPPLPATMMEAIFDDPSFDFVAYLDWHNS
ncbi:hypothetical protein ACFIOY_00260 [Bradyrhizobium sp. TZ2]